MKLTINTYRTLFHSTIALLLIFPWPIVLRPASIIAGISIIDFFLRFWIILISITLPFYFLNVYYLVPAFLKKRKYALYILSILISGIIYLLLDNFLDSSDMRQKVLSLEMPPRKTLHILPFMLLFGIGTSFEMILGWETQERRDEKIQKEKISAELSFLKTQINPHFLFNSLNNIYSLSERGSPKTGEAILLLSGLMRYVLYDSNRGRIQLLKEIEHIDAYIRMQKIRVSPVEELNIQFESRGDLKGLMIEPLLLIPFIENAFKYGASYDSPSTINIDLFVKNELMMFSVFNSKKGRVSTVPSRGAEFGGIGISNTRRRLELIYGSRHELKIVDALDYYKIVLSIKLTDDDWNKG